MSTPSHSIIERWNNSYRSYSEDYIQPFKQLILQNCLFSNTELANGHSSALSDIEKNKGNIATFVMEYTPKQYLNMLPSKLLSDSYSFDLKHKQNYSMIYRNIISSFIQWKPGTTNALSKETLNITYNSEQFECKFRKYQLESMKKFIQATPGTKEIRGQWAANLANDSLMVSFNNNSLILIIKIGSFNDKLSIMYEENGSLRKNSKIRKQTLLTHCWGLEKTKLNHKFHNSIIIQENYGIDLFANDILKISEIIIYKNNNNNIRLNNNIMIINGNEIDLNCMEINEINIPKLNPNQKLILRNKYKNLLSKGNKLKKVKPKKIKIKPKKIKIKPKKIIKPKKKVMKEENTSDDDSDFYPIKPNDNNDNDDDEKWYVNKSKKKNKKDPMDYVYYTNDSTSCVSIPIINKDTLSLPTYGYNTPQGARYDNNFNDTPMGHTATNDIDISMNNNILIPPIINTGTFDPILNNTPTFDNDTMTMNWTSFDTPNINPLNRYGSIDSLGGGMNNSQFNNNFETNNLSNIANLPFNNDIDLDLIDNNTNNNPYPSMSFIDNTNNTNNNNEVDLLRQQNELLLHRVEQQQRQIEFLASQIGAIHSNQNNYNYNDTYIPQSHNPLKRRRISKEALLPPAA